MQILILSWESKTSSRTLQLCHFLLVVAAQRENWRCRTSSRSRASLSTRRVKRANNCRRPQFSDFSSFCFRNHCMVCNWNRIGQQVRWWAAWIRRRPTLLVLHRGRHHGSQAVQWSRQQPRILRKTLKHLMDAQWKSGKSGKVWLEGFFLIADNFPDREPFVVYLCTITHYKNLNKALKFQAQKVGFSVRHGESFLLVAGVKD